MPTRICRQAHAAEFQCASNVTACQGFGQNGVASGEHGADPVSLRRFGYQDHRRMGDGFPLSLFYALTKCCTADIAVVHDQRQEHGLKGLLCQHLLGVANTPRGAGLEAECAQQTAQMRAVCVPVVQHQNGMGCPCRIGFKCHGFESGTPSRGARAGFGRMALFLAGVRLPSRRMLRAMQGRQLIQARQYSNRIDGA